MSIGQSFDYRAYQLEWAQKQLVRDTFAPTADPTSSTRVLRKEQTPNATLIRGIVVDAFPYIHAYRVKFEFMAPERICTLGSQTSLTPIGAHELNTLLPGTPVWVAVTPNSTTGMIVFAEPTPATDPALAFSDWIHITSRCGMHVDKVCDAVFQTVDSGWLYNWACGRPMDSIPIGEWGAVTETGLMISIDSFMAQLRADESTGITAFYHDQLLRVAGVNLQEFSSGHVREFKHDQGEIRIYEGWTPYPWEQLGAFTHTFNPTIANTAGDVQNTEPWYASLEPANDDQIPFHRRIFLGGYIGQGGKDIISVPPNKGDCLTLGTNNTTDTMPTGVLEEQRTLPGMYLVRSAKCIHIMKQSAIPSPVQNQNPEDLTGDTSDNYSFAGIVNNNSTPHVVASSVKTNADQATMQRIAGLQDEIALNRNWEGEAALYYHKKDWKLQEEQDSAVAVNYTPIPLDKLDGNFLLPEPTPIKVNVDARYGDVDYYLNEAGIHFLDNGSVILRGGCGEQLVFAQGNCYIDVPGDTHIRSGRSTVMWAGRDIINRAYGCVDISSSTADVRLKADVNMHMLAGNSGDGGVLIESRGTDSLDFKNLVGTDVTSGGIILKATTGSVLTYGNNLYLRATNYGTILLDADTGNGNIVEYTSAVSRYIANSCTDYFGPPSNITATNTCDGTQYRLGTALSINGGLTALGGASFSDDINIIGGYIYSDQQGGSGYVGNYGTDPSQLRSLKDSLQNTSKAMKNDNSSGNTLDNGPLQKAWYDSGQPGDDATIPLIQFSFRTTKQYKTKDFVLWEPTWQQMARNTKIKLVNWTEPVVKAGSQETMPYPGQDSWKTQSTYYQQDLTLFDYNKGVAVNRADNQSAYEKPVFAQVTPTTLDGNYPILQTPPTTTGSTP